MVRVPPSGTWDRRRADLYALSEDWVGPARTTREAGLRLLVNRYLGAFGPAISSDIGVWAGVPRDLIDSTLEGMDLRRYDSEDGKTLFDLKRAPLPDPDVIAPVRFLPVWDALLLVHARRKAVIAEDHRPIIFNTKTPQSMPTFMIDGTVAGTWRHDGGRVHLAPFFPIPRKWQRDLEQEADALAAFHA